MTECKFGKQKYSPKGEIGGEKKKKGYLQVQPYLFNYSHMTRTRSCTNILTHIHTGCSIHCSIKVMFQHTNKYFLFQDYPS